MTGEWERARNARSTYRKYLRWFEYDNARQLSSARNQSSANSATQVNGYGYDPAGNRSSDSFFNPLGQAGNGTFHNYEPNALNEIASFSTQEGNISPPTVELSYDLGGNLINDGEGKTFEWDAANRLNAINYASGQRTEFAYDGLGRRVKITEYGPGVTATIQPSGSEYTKYSTAPFAFTSGSYSLIFEGLNNSGNNVALIDLVGLNNSMVVNGSFESPDVGGSPGGYQYNPTDATWSYVGDAGLASNGSDLTSSNPDAPDGRQVAFIQNAGVISEIRTVTAGTYTLAFYAAQRDGNTMDQQVRVNLRPSGAGVSVKRFVWCGSRICEERDSSGLTVTKRFFPEGEQRIGGSDAGNYYYSRDHLGSIREVTDASGALKARYDYDPYGKSVVVDGNMNVDFGYTGHYFHAPSGLNLTLYRAYNPALGRWLSRDPIGEAGGVNLYGYVENNPINFLDPLGLWQFTLGGGYLYGGLITFGYNGGHVNFGGFIGFAEGIFGELDTEDKSRSGGFNCGVRVHADAGVRFLKGRKQVGLSGDSGGAFMENGGPDPGFSLNLGGRPFNVGGRRNEATFGAGVGAVIGIGATWTFGP